MGSIGVTALKEDQYLRCNLTTASVKADKNVKHVIAFLGGNCTECSEEPIASVRCSHYECLKQI